MKTFEMDLPKVLQFEKDNRTMYNLSLHAIYHRKQYDLVKAVDNTKLKMPAGLMPSWDKGIEAESDLVNESSFSRLTAKMDEKEHERDKLLKGIFLVVEGHKYSATEANREAAFRIDEKLRAYAKAAKTPHDKESALILGLKKDMTGLDADITTVGLTASFARLYVANDEYMELQKTRSITGADSQLPAAIIVRPKTDAALDTVCQYIQMAYLSATSDDDRALIEQLVDRMNKIARETRGTQRQMRADRKPKDPKTPKDPKKPKPDDEPEIHLPEEDDPKKPDEKPKDPKTPGGDDAPEIHLPEE